VLRERIGASIIPQSRDVELIGDLGHIELRPIAMGHASPGRDARDQVVDLRFELVIIRVPIPTTDLAMCIAPVRPIVSGGATGLYCAG
jgi:hypothetical protein